MKPSLVIVAIGSLLGCFPQLDDTPWLIEETRILAVRGSPAEAEPLESVRFEALVASPGGATTDEGVAWSLCLRPRALAERNGVAPECLGEGEAIQPLFGRIGEVPVDACALFGPNPPPADPGEPPLRAADPDTTGGYHLPVRASLPGGTAFAFERLTCSLAGAPREVFREYRERYTKNQHPRIVTIEVVGADGPQPIGGEAFAPSREVTFRVRTSSASAESYVQYDGVAVALLDRVESMVVSWFATAGAFEAAKTGLSEVDVAGGAVSFDNRWTPPIEPQRVHLFVVLRDARGGVDWRNLEVAVQ